MFYFEKRQKWDFLFPQQLNGSLSQFRLFSPFFPSWFVSFNSCLLLFYLCVLIFFLFFYPNFVFLFCIFSFLQISVLCFLLRWFSGSQRFSQPMQKQILASRNLQNILRLNYCYFHL